MWKQGSKSMAWKGTTSIFASHRQELRNLIPPLEPLDCVQQSMKAILGNETMVCIPSLMNVAGLSRA